MSPTNFCKTRCAVLFVLCFCCAFTHLHPAILKMNELERRKAIEAGFRSGKTAKEISGTVKFLGISRATVYGIVSRLEANETMHRASGGGRKLANQTKDGIRKIRQRLQRNPKQSVRKIAQEIGLLQSTAQRITQKHLQLCGRKKQKRQFLTDTHRQIQKTNCAHLRHRLANGLHRKVLFSDEKNFLLTQLLNPQNDRIYTKIGEKKSPEESAVGHAKFPQKIMVWIGCEKKKKTAQ